MPRRFADFDDYWNNWADRIDKGEYLDYINRELGPRNIYLSDAEIKQALSELKNAARSGDEDQVVETLKNKLNNDLESNRSQGLHRSRSQFLISSFVAHRLRSNELARALLRFFSKKGTEIVEEEKPFMLSEWCLALTQLEDLVPHDKWSKAFRQVAGRGPPMLEEWRRPGPYHSWANEILRPLHGSFLRDHGRGEDQLQLIAPRVRRLSVPAFRRPSIIEIPPYPRTSYDSPMVTTRHALDALHLRQTMQAFELDRLRRDVDDLRYDGWR
jgi:hypothetical protein